MKYLEGYPELDLLSRTLSFTSASLRVTTRIEAYSCKAIKAERRLFKTLENDMVADLHQSTSISPPEQHSALLESAFGRLDKKESRKTLWLLIATLNLAFPDHDFSRVAADEFRREDSAKAVLVSLTSALTNVRASGSHIPIYRSLSNYHSMSTSLPAYMPSSAAISKSKGTASRSRRSVAVSPGKGSFAPGMYSSSTTAASVVIARLAALIGDNGPGSTSDNNVPGDLPSQPLIRQVLDPIIQLGDCEVFSYTPDVESDPHAYPSDDDYCEEDEDEDGEFHKANGPDKSEGEMGEDDMMVDSNPTHHDNNRHRFDGVVGAASYVPHLYRIPPSDQDQWRSLSHAQSGRLQRVDDGRSAFPFGIDGFASDSDDRSTGRYYRDGSADSDEADQTGGLLWSSNHFFYNKKMRRIVFISCWGRKVSSSSAAESAQAGRTKPWQPIAGSAMLPGQGLSKSVSPLKKNNLPLPFPHVKRDMTAQATAVSSLGDAAVILPQTAFSLAPPELQRTESDPVLQASSAFTAESADITAAQPSCIADTAVSPISPFPAQPTGSGRHWPRRSRNATSGRKARRGDSGGKPSPSPSQQSYRDRSPQKHSHSRQNRKHHTTPPASGPSTPSVLSQRSYGSMPPSPAAAGSAPSAPPAAAAVSIMPGSSILPPAVLAAQAAQMSSPQSSEHSHGTSHRRQKRRTSTHGGTPSDRRRRTAHVTPAVKLA